MTKKQLDFLKETNRDNLLGRYISRLQEQIENASTEDERQMLEEALQSGVKVLIGDEWGAETREKEESP